MHRIRYATWSRHADEDRNAAVRATIPNPASMRTTITVPEISERLGICEEPAKRSAERRLAEEKYYTPQELASIWRFSPATIRKLFRNEPGVLKLQGLGTACGKRSYTTFSIP